MLTVFKFPSALHDGVIRNKNRVQRRKRLRAMMLAGEWERISLEFNFTPKFTPVINGKNVFDWKCIPMDVRHVLRCGGLVKETPYTKQGGIFDHNEKPKHKPRFTKQGIIPREKRVVRHTLVERIPIRIQLYEAQKGRCYYCDTFIEPHSRKWSIDHKIPISRGGTNEDSNLVGACNECNSNKSSMTHDEFLASGFIAFKIKLHETK